MKYLAAQCKIYGLKIKELDGNKFSKTGYKIYDLDNGFTLAFFKDIKVASKLQKENNYLSTLKINKDILFIE